MMPPIEGRAWCFGDNIDTDVLAPGAYMKGPIKTLAAHCLEAVNPDFPRDVRPGDIVVGGRNFGMGSSREQAVMALRELNVGAVIAQSFAGIFYRNALNLGLLALVSPDAAKLTSGMRLRIEPVSARGTDILSGHSFACETLPSHLLDMIAAGGLLPHLERRLARERSGATQLQGGQS